MSAGCTLRAAVVLSTWLHEAAHLVAAVMLGDRTCLTAANISGDHRSGNTQRLLSHG